MRTVLIVVACGIAMAVSGTAQQKPTGTAAPEKPAVAAAPAEAKPLVPLKVQLVLSRFKGEKKISSLPYILGVAANERGWTNVRMGIEVPIGRKGDLAPGGGISYRSVGTNIDCMADSTAEGPFRLAIRVEDSSVLAEPSKGTNDATAIVGDMPAFRSFKTNFTILLRDGQTTQYTSAVDPVSGEIMKIDVTLSVIK
jgi:hypothetical protein